MDEKLQRLTREALETIWEQYPEDATMQGVHAHDGRLARWSDEARRAFAAKLERHLEALRALDGAALTARDRRDARLLEAGLRMHLCDLLEVRPAERNPGHALSMGLDGIFILMVREHAELPERLARIAERCDELVRVVREARAALKDVVPEFARYALSVCDGAKELLQGGVGKLAEQAPEPVRARVHAAAERALAAVKAYRDEVEREVLPRANAGFAVGRKTFEFKLRNDHFLPYDAPGLRALGERVYDSTLAEMRAVASRIRPGAELKDVLAELKKDHPPHDRFLDAYRGEMVRARAFVLEKKLATIPEGEELAVIESPAHLRSVIPFAAYQPPAPYEKRQMGFFFVTTPPPGDEDAAGGHASAGVPVTSLHEGYPGHHLQLAVANRVGTPARWEFGNAVFAEGWALYCEEMMYEEGFFRGDADRLWQLKDQLWRACRVVLDVDLHTGAIGFDGAVKFLVERAFGEEPNARAEALRYCMTPTQPMSYVVGKMALLDLRDRYRARRGAGFTLGEYHDRVLATATVPPALAAEEVMEGL
jgi:uncharacterized protein (DUF885 family)